MVDIFNKVIGMRCARLISLSFIIFHLSFSPAGAQVGDHRSELAVGFNGGYVLSSVGFIPKVPQSQHAGLTGGLTVRYTSEKYFNSICAIVGEVNFAQIGWKENILTPKDEPVINPATGLAEAYQRTMTYVQVPVFARLGWGRERKGFQFFFQAGPQIGYLLSESTDANFDLKSPNVDDRTSIVSSEYVNSEGLQLGSGMYFMPAENKLDYGIAAGGGVELSLHKAGHLQLEARYYYGLGDIYGNSKRDYFGRSNFSNIVFKLTYLFDLKKTINSKIK